MRFTIILLQSLPGENYTADPGRSFPEVGELAVFLAIGIVAGVIAKILFERRKMKMERKGNV